MGVLKSLSLCDRGCNKPRQLHLYGHCKRMPDLVLMRHGATVWGQENKFSGWGDTALSATGLQEAKTAGKALATFGFDLVFTSVLLRSQQTAICVMQQSNSRPPIIRADWRLNERHYGALQGHGRAEMIARFGNQQVVAWRRSFHAVPPLLADDDGRWLEQVTRWPEIPYASQPRAESMAQAAVRAEAVWDDAIMPALGADKTILVVAHTSSLRALSKIIHGLDDTATEEFRIATAIPRRYRFNADLSLVDYEDIQSGVKSKFRTLVNRLKPKRWGLV
jgi:2,3-bisphosphoglycerate-dependent phosphoglycerate mutase